LTDFEKITVETLKKTGKPWKHYIWVNDRTLLGETIKMCEERGYIIKDIDSLNWSEDEYLVYKHFTNNGYWGPAGDVVRFSILRDHGGLYLDFD